MNKAVYAFLAALTLISLAAPGPSAADPVTSHWMLAQSTERQRPTCESDNRRLPRGAMVCREGKQLRCGPYGNWIETGKAC